MIEGNVRRQRRLRLLFALFAFLAVQAGSLYIQRHDIAGGGPDFSGFYSAAAIAAAGEGGKFYDLDTQRREQAKIVTVPYRRGGVLPFNHPPHELLLYLPLVPLGYLGAFAAWFVVNLALLAASFRVLKPHIPQLWDHLPFAVLALAGMLQISATLAHGQDSILMLALFAAAFAAFAGGREMLAGAALAVAFLKFQMALPLLLLFAVARKWRVLAGWIVTGVALAAVSAIVIGPGAVLGYPQFLLGYSQQPVEASYSWPRMMPNLHGFVALLFGTDAPDRSVALVTLGASLLVFAGAALLWRKHLERNPELAFSLGIVAACLVSYHHYPHDQVVLIAAMLLLADYLLRTRVAGARRVLGWAGIVAVIATAYLPGPRAGAAFAAVLVLFVALAMELRRTAPEA